MFRPLSIEDNLTPSVPFRPKELDEVVALSEGSKSFLDYMLIRFNFSVKWRSWIRACVFVGNLTVLVNGCPTREIMIEKGVKTGRSVSSLPLPACG